MPGHRCRLAIVALVVMLIASRPGAEPRAPELAVVVHVDNPETPSAAELEDIFLRKQLRWANGQRIIPFNATAESARRRGFDGAVLGLSPDEVARYWLDQRIRGGVAAPRDVGDPVLTLKLVTRLPAAIGYVPADAQLQGTRVVAWIRDGKLRSP